MNLDQTICRRCRQPLPLMTHRRNRIDATAAYAVQVWPDGTWHSSCLCGWDSSSVAGTSEPIPTWRTVAPELCAEIDRLGHLVSEAYAEGWSDGAHGAELGQSGPHQGCYSETWERSDACAALDPTPSEVTP